MEMERKQVHSIEFVEFYLGPPCSMFGFLSERIVAGNMRIQVQNILHLLFAFLEHNQHKNLIIVNVGFFCLMKIDTDV